MAAGTSPTRPYSASEADFSRLNDSLDSTPEVFFNYLKDDQSSLCGRTKQMIKEALKDLSFFYSLFSDKERLVEPRIKLAAMIISNPEYVKIFVEREEPSPSERKIMLNGIETIKKIDLDKMLLETATTLISEKDENYFLDENTKNDEKEAFYIADCSTSFELINQLSLIEKIRKKPLGSKVAECLLSLVFSSKNTKALKHLVKHVKLDIKL